MYFTNYGTAPSLLTEQKSESIMGVGCVLLKTHLLSVHWMISPTVGTLKYNVIDWICVSGSVER